jgi:hypothetical protein
MEAGKLVLNENPKNYFEQVEQIALSPAHMIPGIEPSPDKILQVTKLCDSRCVFQPICHSLYNLQEFVHF